MPRAVGLDFGTTNSAIAVVDSDGTAQLATFQADGHTVSTFRSILYSFHPKDNEAGGRRVVAGPAAIPAYQEAEPRGRFIQSIKSFLASRLFEQTNLYHRTYQLEDLIATIVQDLRTTAEAQFGAIGPDIVVGRPVCFAGASDADDEALALSRLRQAVQQCGFDNVSFEYEPVAAASYYETQLDHDELVLIADFGGGTSDFSLLRLGPSMRGASMRDNDDERNRILGTAGVAIGGNDFDSQFIRHLVAPALGAGSTYTSFGKMLPMPRQLYAELERWDKLSFLKTGQTLNMLHEIRSQAHEPDKIEGLLCVIEEELGYQLYKAIEDIKFTLSTKAAGTFVFNEPPVEITADVTREAFETWICRDIDDMRMCIDHLLEQCHVTPGDIDSIFMTGGSSLVPIVRRLFADKFSPDRLRSGGELTSVARGLALRALMR
ncbi:MAG: Hsp70 family protein [Candidatus Tectomicrobia bacterium]|nr:Hsp70 family protein [Candidatus Tectomicrobia bacterium]